MRNSGSLRTRRALRCLLAVCSVSAVSASTFGAAVIEPDSQPTMTLAPYVLKNTNLELTGGTRAYRPWFENGAWTGDLLEYIITEEGIRLLRTDVGYYPRDGADWRGDGTLWSARQKFPDWEPYDAVVEGTEGWECTEEDADYWKTRSLFTYTKGERVEFLWDELSDAQREALDPGTVAEGGAGPDSSPILNFVRGDRSKERCKEGGIYRWRFGLLGAIINSRPVYVPTGTDGLVVVGANDGMVHGFSAKDGSEVFGYLPSLLMDKLGALRASPYKYTYFVDGELRHRDIGTVAAPQHVVTGGFGAGAKGIYALDVTSATEPEILFEIAGYQPPGVDDGFNGGAYNESVGYIHGRPTIAKLPDNEWYVVTGNGYESDVGTGQLLLIRISDGNVTSIATGEAGGLSAPSLVDLDGDQKADYAYAGGLSGNLWRFNLKDKTKSKLFAAGADKPITVEPELAVHPTGLGVMVFFGTGSLLSAADADNKDTQSFYGIWDRGDGALVPENRLVTQVIEQTTNTWEVREATECGTAPEVTESESTVRFVPEQKPLVWTDNTPEDGDKRHLGWKVDLPRLGERVIGHPQVRAERIQFVTTNPLDMKNPDETANDAGSWVMQLSQATGASLDPPRALFDFNRNCVLDEDDALPWKVTEGEEEVAKPFFPVGLNLGPYNIAQPAIARIGKNDAGGVDDGIYINALSLLPVEEAGLAFRGQIDVTTDSPRGPVQQPLPEPAKEPFGLRPFPEASGPTKPFLRADGLGHRVDGHSFGYNKVHGVDYIDFFDLEPRRGKLRLDVGTVYKGADGKYYPINPREAERELNKVTEVGIPRSQKFIVVLANADLSSGNELQIGCRTWPVYEYQTMMMKEHLRAHAGAAPGVDLSSLAAKGLIFTLDDIDTGKTCSNGVKSTLRITPTDRVGKLDVLMGTLPGVVNNTDLYAGKTPDTHLTRKSEFLNADGTFKAGKGPADLYTVDPHVTLNKEGQKGKEGYRWRNGALTIQLLAVTNDNKSAYSLQDASLLPTGSGTEGKDLGWGGAYAKGFSIVKDQGDNVVKPVTDGASPPAEAAVTNGLLYESSIFWHWGDMARFQTEGTGNPVIAAGYGASGNQTPSLMYETEWFTPGAYQQLTADFTEELQAEYVRLLKQLESADEDLVYAALTALAELLKLAKIEDYHRLRSYVPNSKQLQEDHLIMIDRGGKDGVLQTTLDGTPAKVLDIETDIIPTLGPNFQPGRRSWIDITPTSE